MAKVGYAPTLAQYKLDQLEVLRDGAEKRLQTYVKRPNIYATAVSRKAEADVIVSANGAVPYPDASFRHMTAHQALWGVLPNDAARKTVALGWISDFYTLTEKPANIYAKLLQLEAQLNGSATMAAVKSIAAFDWTTI